MAVTKLLRIKEGKGSRQNRPLLDALKYICNPEKTKDIYIGAAGMTDEEKNRPLQERINVTMNYADRQIARFIHAVENEEWYKNTYVIVMADHGFPLGENGVSTMNGGGYSNITWIPFFIHGKGLDAVRDTTTAAQIDIAPTNFFPSIVDIHVFIKLVIAICFGPWNHVNCICVNVGCRKSVYF